MIAGYTSHSTPFDGAAYTRINWENLHSTTQCHMQDNKDDTHLPLYDLYRYR